MEINRFHINQFRPCSGCTWPSWPQVCRPQLQASPVLLGRSCGAELPGGWVRHPDDSHEVENRVSHLLPGGALPDNRGHGVPGSWAAARELPETDHSHTKTGLPGHAHLRQLLRAGRSGEGRRLCSCSWMTKYLWLCFHPCPFLCWFVVGRKITWTQPDGLAQNLAEGWSLGQERTQ